MTPALLIGCPVPGLETRITNEKEASFVGGDNFKTIFDKQKPCENDDERKKSKLNALILLFVGFGLSKIVTQSSWAFFSSFSHLINYFILEHSKKKPHPPNTDVDETQSILRR